MVEKSMTFSYEHHIETNKMMPYEVEDGFYDYGS